MKKDAEYWIKKLSLTRHPEGGYYKEIYRSNDIIKENFLPLKYKGSRSASTFIYFLLKSSDFSCFHRLKSDEIWHFYYGDSLKIFIIDDKGSLIVKNLGTELENDESFHAVIKALSWFGAKVNAENSYTLIGCTVAPGFEFNDFEIAKRSELIHLFPAYEDIIKELTRNS